MLWENHNLTLYSSLLCAVVLTAFQSAGAESSPPDGVTKKRVEEVLPEFSKYVEKSRQEWQVPSVAAAVVFDDEILWWKGYGERGGGVAGPPDLETVYAIGSTTKAFCAATLAIMVDQEKFDWDSRVVDYYPSFRMADPWVTREMRVSDLLAQHSGMPTQALSMMAAMGYSRDDVVAAMGWVEPVTSFRHHFAYVNTPHIVAGKMVAQANGETSWEQAARKILFEPLQMNRTTWTPEGLDDDPNRAPGHALIDGEVRAVEAGPFPYVLGPAGGLNSCLNDMSHWVRMHLHNGTFAGTRIVSEENLGVTRTPQTVLDPDQFYCMGWISQLRGNHRLIWHNGGTAGHKTFVGIQPDHKLGLIVLSNLGDTVMPDAVGMKFFSLVHQSDNIDYSANAKQDRDRPAGDEKRTIQPPPAAASLTGQYASPALGQMRIGADDEGLKIRFEKPSLEARLVHRDGAVFQIQYTTGWLAEIGWTNGGIVRFNQSELGDFDSIQIRLGELPNEGATFRAGRQSVAAE